MATEYSFSMEGQPYFNSNCHRSIEVFYTEPDSGINSSTGILLLISGFEGDTSANVYKKMRMEFSEQQNLVVVQCDYLGFQFMGSKTMSEVHKKMQSLAEEINENTENREQLMAKGMKTNLEQNETLDNFCELGIFQALDNLKAVKKIIEFIERRGLTFDYNRIIAYGYSHGAYLALLCNALMPNLFSGIIDNSGWIYPVYLYRPRVCSAKWNVSETEQNVMLYVFVHYKGRLWIDDLEVYNLRRLYTQFDNRAKILSFHGENDGLVPLKEKANFLEKIKHAQLYVITEKDVDKKIFFNTQHGMGSNFLKLFYFITSIDKLKREETSKQITENLWKSHIFTSRKYQYRISEELDIFRTEK